MVKTPKTPKTQRTPKRKETPKVENAAEDTSENEAKRPRQLDLMNFFQRKQKPVPPPTVPRCMPDDSLFKTLFQLKGGMTLAPPLFRTPLSQAELDHLLEIRCEESAYLTECKARRRKNTATNTDILKPKYFHFHDNYRPPYYGTWRRRSKAILGRRPISKEEKTINYDYDSDDDWEEEPEDAEECKSDEEIEKDDPLEEDDDENDGFLVEHGYLSSGEGSGAEEEGEEENDEGKKERRKSSNETEEQRRLRLEQKAEEWKESRRQKERRLKKKNMQPNLYLPDELPYPNPVFQRFILPGVLFNYANLIQMADNLYIEEEKAPAMEMQIKADRGAQAV